MLKVRVTILLFEKKLSLYLYVPLDQLIFTIKFFKLPQDLSVFILDVLVHDLVFSIDFLHESYLITTNLDLRGINANLRWHLLLRGSWGRLLATSVMNLNALE